MTPLSWLSVAGAGLVGWLLFPVLAPQSLSGIASAFWRFVPRISAAFVLALLTGLILKSSHTVPSNAAAPLETKSAPRTAPQPVEVKARPTDSTPTINVAKPAPSQSKPVETLIEAPSTQPAPPTPIQRVEVPAAPPAMRVEPPATGCARFSGLQREICTACARETGFARMICEGNTRGTYCADRLGRDPDCPEPTRSDPA